LTAPIFSFLFRRLLPLLAGFVIWGLSIALQVRAGLGLSPWDVFHQGLGFRTGLTIGMAGVVTGFAILLLWIPLRVKPGIATVLNAFTIGPSADFFLWLIPPIDGLHWHVLLLVLSLLLIGISSALYLPARLGPGPRDGLMVGLNKRFGFSIRLSRSIVEVTALIVGFFLGGTVGLGTLAIALGLGHVVQASLKARRRLVERLTGKPAADY
jgi:uncharacterized membrane protein YczE